MSFGPKRIAAIEKAKFLAEQLKKDNEICGNIIQRKGEGLTNFQVAEILHKTYPDLQDFLGDQITEEEEIIRLHRGVDALIPQIFSEEGRAKVSSIVFGKSLKQRVNFEDLMGSMREKSLQREGIEVWGDSQTELLIDLCQVHHTGPKLDRTKVIEKFQAQFPNHTNNYINRQIDVKYFRGLGINNPWKESKKITSKYMNFLRYCMDDLQYNPDSKYRILGNGKRKVNNQLIINDFKDKFPSFESDYPNIILKTVNIGHILCNIRKKKGINLEMLRKNSEEPSKEMEAKKGRIISDRSMEQEKAIGLKRGDIVDILEFTDSGFAILDLSKHGRSDRGIPKKYLEILQEEGMNGTTVSNTSTKSP